MAEDTKQAWMKVGERFGSVGKRVSDRYKQGGSDEAGAEEEQRKLEEIAKELIDKVDRAVGAVDGTVRDPDARTDLREALNALGDALTVTARDVGSAVRRGESESADEPYRPDDTDASPPA
jgi:hypothetical protein